MVLADEKRQHPGLSVANSSHNVRCSLIWPNCHMPQGNTGAVQIGYASTVRWCNTKATREARANLGCP